VLRLPYFWWLGLSLVDVRVCAARGWENPPNARFCNEYGAGWAAAPPSGQQRKTVTVLFCNVTGSTALGEWLDPESVTGTEERLATGDAVNLGARLEHVAGPGAIVIDPQTWRMVRGTVTAEPLQLRGKSHPVIAYG
jgi:class 3 adenylate cyclase